MTERADSPVDVQSCVELVRETLSYCFVFLWTLSLRRYVLALLLNTEQGYPV